jgi:RimJ/RimL family protein N-acetyltransferase
VIHFRPLTLEDLPTLADWLARPHVAQWWNETPTVAELTADYGPLIAGELPHRAYIALEEGRPIGFIQSYVAVECHHEGWWLDEDDAGVRGIDQFLADGARLGQGLGTQMVRAFVDHLFADRRVTRIQTDPSPDNPRAVRCYEKAGFRIDRQITTPDGPAVLMYRGR